MSMKSNKLEGRILKTKILEFLVKAVAAMPYITILAVAVWIVTILVRL